MPIITSFKTEFKTNALPSFSLFETVIIFILLGILSSIAFPIFQDTSLQKAKEQILTDIRLTKNLALKDHRQTIRNFNQQWDLQSQSRVQQTLLQSWRIQFHHIVNQNEGYIGSTYSIFAKRPRRDGSIDNGPMGYVNIARNPINGKCMSWYNYGDMPKHCKDLRDDRLKLEERYHITKIDIEWNTKGCHSAHKTIHYDGLGVAYCGSSKLHIINPQAQLILHHRNGQQLKINLAPFL